MNGQQLLEPKIRSGRANLDGALHGANVGGDLPRHALHLSEAGQRLEYLLRRSDDALDLRRGDRFGTKQETSELGELTVRVTVEPDASAFGFCHEIRRLGRENRRRLRNARRNRGLITAKFAVDSSRRA